MRIAVLISILFHGFIAMSFLAMSSGRVCDFLARVAPFLQCEARRVYDPEPIVPIELIELAESDLTTSVPAASPEPVEEPAEQPDLETPEEQPPVEQEPAPEPEPEPEPEPVLPEPEPEPEEPEPEPEPEPPKPEPKPQPEKEEDEGLDFAKLSALVDKERENQPVATQQPSQTTEQADQARAAVGAGDRLTASDISKMQAAVSRCWNASAVVGAPEPERLKVVLEIRLNRDGTLVEPPTVLNKTQIAFSGNRFWQVAEQNAIRAVNACQPYDFLAQDRYDSWKELELNFDPSQMAGF